MENKKSWGFSVILAAAWASLLFLFLPTFVAVPISLTPERYLSLPSGEISFRHYINLFTSDEWLSSMGQSVWIAVGATVIAVLLGTLCAGGLWRIATRFSEMVRMYVLMPLVIPPIVSALAFYQISVDLGLHDTSFGLILAHAILGVPYVIITVSTSLANIDLKLEQASRSLGASVSQTLRWVIFPCIKPGIFSGAVFAFIMSWDEIVVTLFITSIEIFTLPRRIWDGIREHTDPTIAAAATALIMITLLGVGVYFFSVFRQQRLARTAARVEG